MGSPSPITICLHQAGTFATLGWRGEAAVTSPRCRESCHADAVGLLFQLARCSVLGPEDFGNSSRFHELHPASHGPAAPRTGLSCDLTVKVWNRRRFWNGPS
ncbi:unnamed protein product [Lepidochelys kempii]